jgi:hypothetical protein
MKKDYKKAIRSLDTFLADDSHLPFDQAKKELTESGVNVDAFLKEFEKVVRKGYQFQMKKVVEQEQKQAKERLSNPFGDIASKTLAEIKGIFEAIKGGAFGIGMRDAALARCRNQIGDKVSEAELRSWLEDIAAANNG